MKRIKGAERRHKRKSGAAKDGNGRSGKHKNEEVK